MSMFFEDAVLLRLFLSEDDKYEGKPTYKCVVELCKERHISGATVFRGLLGYGKSSTLHRGGLFGLSSDLPVVVEIVDKEENIKGLLPELMNIIKDGVITVERVKVVKRKSV